MKMPFIIYVFETHIAKMLLFTMYVGPGPGALCRGCGRCSPPLVFLNFLLQQSLGTVVLDPWGEGKGEGNLASWQKKPGSRHLARG